MKDVKQEQISKKVLSSFLYGYTYFSSTFLDHFSYKKKKKQHGQQSKENETKPKSNNRNKNKTKQIKKRTENETKINISPQEVLFNYKR